MLSEMKEPGMARHSHSPFVVALEQGDVLRLRDPKQDYKEAGMVSDKRWVGIMMAMLALSALLINACSQKSTEERMAEKVLKSTTGKDAQVKIQEGKIKIEQDGSKTEIAETTTWPVEMFTDVPQFTAGKINRVVKSREKEDQRKFNIYFVDVKGDGIKNYADALKEKGWQTELMQMGDKGGILNAQKGKLGLNFPFSLETKEGTLVVFNTP
jgi:hypothetical protein